MFCQGAVGVVYFSGVGAGFTLSGLGGQDCTRRGRATRAFTSSLRRLLHNTSHQLHHRFHTQLFTKVTRHTRCTKSKGSTKERALLLHFNSNRPLHQQACERQRPTKRRRSSSRPSQPRNSHKQDLRTKRHVRNSKRRRLLLPTSNRRKPFMPSSPHASHASRRLTPRISPQQTTTAPRRRPTRTHRQRPGSHKQIRQDLRRMPRRRQNHPPTQEGLLQDHTSVSTRLLRHSHQRSIPLRNQDTLAQRTTRQETRASCLGAAWLP